MNFKSRAPVLAPIYTLGSIRNTTTSPAPEASPTSQSSPRTAAATTTDTWVPRVFMDRKDSSNSDSSTLSSASATSMPRSKRVSSASSSNVNQFTYCGRHTDQYLLSGWSKVFKRKH